MRNAFLLFLVLEAFQKLTAQENQEAEKQYRNSIRFNVTNPIILSGKSIIFGYERVLNKQNAFSVNFGHTGFPSLKLLSSDSLESNSKVSERGYNFSIDYRFYLSKENKYHAPRGVYIGPYYSFNYFERKDSWLLKSTSGGNAQHVESKTSLDVHSLGVEMGYQFIFWKRVSLDMILVGPGVAAYNLKLSVGSDLSDEDKRKFFENLNQALEDKIPGYSRVIDESDFQNKGAASTTRLGFRYMVMIGFRF
jgi:hypothetical protein